MVDRRHLEQPSATSQLEEADLEDHRHHLDDQQPTQDHQEQLGSSEDRHSRKRAAKRQRAGVAHEDLRGFGVPPQEAEAGAGERNRDHRQVVGVAHLIALRPGGCGIGAGLVVLPDVDQRIGAEDHDAGTGGEAVEPVGEVDPIAGGRDQQHDPDDHQDQWQLQPFDVAQEGDGR